MPVRREAVRRRVGPALYQVMEPGDQIIAGTWAMSGSAPAWDALAALPAIALGIAGGANHFTNVSGPFTNVSGPVFGGAASMSVFFSTLLMLPLQLRRRQVFVAVTQRQFICYRLSRMGNEPTRPRRQDRGTSRLAFDVAAHALFSESEDNRARMTAFLERRDRT
jgi:hypothetical protein